MEAERSLARVLGGLVDDGSLTGASAAIVRGDETSIVTLGFADLARRVPLSGDARFRLTSLSKPIISALALALVEDGVLALDDPIGRWVPELASPSVMRSARGPVHDVVPAAGPVLVRHLLESTCGWGFPGDLSLPGVEGMLAAAGDGRHRHLLPAPDAWVAALADVPRCSSRANGGSTTRPTTCSASSSPTPAVSRCRRCFIDTSSHRWGCATRASRSPRTLVHSS